MTINRLVAFLELHDQAKSKGSDPAGTLRRGRMTPDKMYCVVLSCKLRTAGNSISDLIFVAWDTRRFVYSVVRLSALISIRLVILR